jgi:hypothetical protein
MKRISAGDAEEWLDPDTFICKGKMYRITVNGKIKRYFKRNMGVQKVKEERK